MSKNVTTAKEIVELAYSWGYVGKILLNGEKKTIFKMFSNAFVLMGKESMECRYLSDTDEIEIKGFLYGAELCGFDTVPEGQKMRVKENGKIGKVIEATKREVFIDLGRDCERFYLDEVEPFFK